MRQRQLYNQQSLSWQTGFARNAGESAHPQLWRGLVGLWMPQLGLTGNEAAGSAMHLKELSGRSTNAVGLYVEQDDWITLDGVHCVRLSSSHGGGGAAERFEGIVLPGTLFSGDFSIWAYCNPDSSYSVDAAVFGKGNNIGQSDSGTVLEFQQTSNRLMIRLHNTEYPFDNSWTADAWNNVAVRRLGTDVLAWIDGQQHATANTSSENGSTANKAAIGTYKHGYYGDDFAGAIGAVGVWDRALSNTEMQTIGRDAFAIVRRRPPVRYCTPPPIIDAGGSADYAADGPSGYTTIYGRRAGYGSRNGRAGYKLSEGALS